MLPRPLIPNTLFMVKRFIRSIAATGILICGASLSHAAGQQEVLDLTGNAIVSGSALSVTGTAPLAAAHVYTYSLEGDVQVSGTGVLAAFYDGPQALGLEYALLVFAPELIPYIQGAVIDVSGKTPLTIVNKFGKGMVTEGLPYGDEILGSLRLKMGLNKAGIPYVTITNVSLGAVLPPAKFSLDKADSSTFIDGSMVISAVAATGSTPAPDLAIQGEIGTFTGIGQTGTDGGSETYEAYLAKGSTETASVVLLNTGTSAGTFTLSAPAVSSTTGYVQKFLVAGKDVTADVTGSSGYTTKTIDSGNVETMIWKVTNKAAPFLGTYSGLLTAVTSGTATVTGTDAVGFYIIAP